MIKMEYILALLMTLSIAACSKEDSSDISSLSEIVADVGIEEELLVCSEHPPIRADKIWKEEGNTILWGGETPDMHFYITDWLLRESNLHFGLGREAFRALLSPEYTGVEEVDNNYKDSERMIFVKGKDRKLVFPISLMKEYEVVNEVLDGIPVLISYCILADFIGVYERTFCNKEFTFAVSGYTYFDHDIRGGLDGFILWDRETESLWWPLINKGVSHIMSDVSMNPLGPEKWRELSWQEIKARHPDALVLKHSQHSVAPIERNSLYSSQDIECN